MNRKAISQFKPYKSRITLGRGCAIKFLSNSVICVFYSFELIFRRPFPLKQDHRYSFEISYKTTQCLLPKNPPKVEYTQLGKPGLKISEVIFGCTSFSSSDWQKQVINEETETVLPPLKYAYYVGLNTGVCCSDPLTGFRFPYTWISSFNAATPLVFLLLFN